MKKVLLGGIVSAVMLFAVSLGKWELLFNIKIMILYVMGLIASYYQADYNPFNLKDRATDRGTVLHIIWTVYLTQLFALLEAFHFNNPQFLELDYLQAFFLAIAVFGLWFRSWAYITLGNFFTMHLEVKNDHQLIESGPYKYLRHPSYTGAFLTYVFNPLFLGSNYSAIIAVILLMWAFRRRINYEEKMLFDKLGIKYENFCKTRKKLIPGIW